MGFDIVIKNGQIIDGTGNPWIKANIAIKDEKIVKIGRIESPKVDRLIDATGLIVCPGFIDIHSHGDSKLDEDPWANNLVRQGVTQFLGGNCGMSPAPTPGRVTDSRYKRTFRTFKEYFNEIENQGTAVNVSILLGHGTLRNYVMGFDEREPTDAELNEMKMLTAKAMEDGVFGLSTGLSYPPGFFAKTDELIEICKVAARYGGLYATHIRDDSKKYFLQSVEEAIEIAEKAGCPVQISHLETHFDAWGMQELALKLLDEARERGVVVSCDTCTMVIGGGKLMDVLPKWAFEGSPEKVEERLRDPAMRKRIKKDARARKWDLMHITASEMYPEFVGKTMEDLIKHKGGDPWDVVFDLLLEGPPNINQAHHKEEDMRIILKHPTCSIETDASIIRFPKEPMKAKYGVIPRGIITYPMIFRKYVRGETRKNLLFDSGAKLLRLEEAIRKMTSLPAQSMGLFDRGLIREGMWADLVLFGKERIRDTATFEFPYQYPEGIDYVLVNGEVVIDNGEHTGLLPGKVLRGPGYKDS